MSRKVGEQERGRGGREGKEEKGRQRREGREGEGREGMVQHGKGEQETGEKGRGE